MSADAPYLLQRIDDLDQWWMRTQGAQSASTSAPRDPPDRSWLLEDAADIVLAVAAYVSAAGDLAALDLRMPRAGGLDVGALRNAGEIFSRARYELTLADGSRFEPQTRIERVRDLPDAVASSELDPLEILLRLSFLGDDPMDALLTAAEDLDALATNLQPLITPKLALLSESDALRLLSEYVAQTDPTREVFIALPDTVRQELASVTNAADARQKIALYLLRDRPQAARSVLERNESASLPMVPVGLARVLSWTSGNAQPTAITAAEQQIAKQIRRLRILWTSLLGKNDNDDLAALAGALGLAKDSPMLRPETRSTGHPASAPDWAALRFVLRALVANADLSERDVPGHVAALWAYKLGLEVMLPGTRNEILRKKNVEQKELALQQQLCRFLVERHIHAHGTKFGPAQVDLLAFDPVTTLVIETKLLKSTPTAGSANKWLAQLLSYMSQEPQNNRGALVLFNAGPVPIITQRRILLVKQRIYIVPINLCAVTPSGRKDAIEVIESPDPRELILLRRPITERKTKVRAPRRPRRNAR